MVLLFSILVLNTALLWANLWAIILHNQMSFLVLDNHVSIPVLLLDNHVSIPVLVPDTLLLVSIHAWLTQRMIIMGNLASSLYMPYPIR